MAATRAKPVYHLVNGKLMEIEPPRPTKHAGIPQELVAEARPNVEAQVRKEEETLNDPAMLIKILSASTKPETFDKVAKALALTDERNRDIFKMIAKSEYTPPDTLSWLLIQVKTQILDKQAKRAKGSKKAHGKQTGKKARKASLPKRDRLEKGPLWMAEEVLGNISGNPHTSNEALQYLQEICEARKEDFGWIAARAERALAERRAILASGANGNLVTLKPELRPSA